jgi:hypothetical protein
LGNAYQFISGLQIPFTNVERYATRIIIMPVLLLLVIGCIRLSALLPEWARGVKGKLVVLAFLWQLSYDLNQHSAVWGLRNIENRYDNGVRPPGDNVIVDLSTRALDARESLYVASVPIALTISIAAALVILWLYWRYWSKGAPIAAAKAEEKVREKQN